MKIKKHLNFTSLRRFLSETFFDVSVIPKETQMRELIDGVNSAAMHYCWKK